MFATASDRRSVRFRALEVPDSLPAAATLVALGLLLLAGGGPLRSALATFALGTAIVIAAMWLRGAVSRHRARRRAEASHAAVLAGAASRLRAAVGDHELAVALDVLTGGPLGPPRSVAAIAREVGAATRAAGVPVVVAVDEDAVVPGLDGAVRALVRRAVALGPPQATVTVAVTTRPRRDPRRGLGGGRRVRRRAGPRARPPRRRRRPRLRGPRRPRAAYARDSRRRNGRSSSVKRISARTAALRMYHGHGPMTSSSDPASGFSRSHM